MVSVILINTRRFCRLALVLYWLSDFKEDERTLDVKEDPKQKNYCREYLLYR